MSKTKFLFFNRLEKSIPKRFIDENMRETYGQIVSRCNIDPELPNEFPPNAPSGAGLIPMAFNLMNDALHDSSLLNRLQQSSHAVGYWFFNLFIVPLNYVFPDTFNPDTFNPENLNSATITVGATGSFDLDSPFGSDAEMPESVDDPQIVATPISSTHPGILDPDDLVSGGNIQDRLGLRYRISLGSRHLNVPFSTLFLNDSDSNIHRSGL